MSTDDFLKAVRENNIESVKRYLKILDPSVDNNYAIRIASDNGHTEVVKLLLSDHRVDPSVDRNYPICAASRYGHTQVVKLLLSDHRVDPSAINNFAIRFASENGHIEVVKLLLSDSRVDPSDYDNWAIQRSSYYGYLEVVKLLLSDSRVNFNAIHNQRMKQQLLREERNKLRKELVFRYQAIEQASPQLLVLLNDDRRSFKQKSRIPSALIRKIVYEAAYLHEKFPFIKLLALADLLKVEYKQDTSYPELFSKVKLVLIS